jgi:UDP-glucose 4-epimerase
VFRPHNVYGERQNLSDPYRNVVGIFTRQTLQGEPCTIFGDGEQTRAFSYVGDVAPLIARSIEVPAAEGQVLNIGSDRQRTVNELARSVQQALGREVGVRHLPERREVRHVTCDHGRLREVFGHRETVGLDEGLRRTVAWAVEIEPGPARRFARVEIRRGLPPTWEELLDP